MKKIVYAFFLSIALALAGCGQAVEVPPAHVGKITTEDGYKENLIPTSKFRLPARRGRRCRSPRATRRI